jgi:hypothetical protein
MCPISAVVKAVYGEIKFRENPASINSNSNTAEIKPMKFFLV